MTTAGSLPSLCRRPATPAGHARAALHLRDWLGCIAAARTHDAAAAFAVMAGTSPVALLAPALAAAPHDPERAAFLTGALGNALEMDDLHRASILHASDVVRPAALAAALHADADGPLTEAQIGTTFTRNPAHHGASPETVLALGRALDALPDAPALATLSSALAAAFGDRP